jgi:putative tryptophan/tyrosine transport system substrate-binding protein
MQLGRLKRRDFITLLGGAAAWPLGARAQQAGRMRRIGVLMARNADDPEEQARLTAFLQGLQESGWSDGRNVRIDIRWSAGDAERRRKYAAELVALAPDVMVADTSTVVAAVQQTTQTVPIVFAGVIDPVGAGFVASLVRPGGNTTGFASLDYGTSGKWLELLKEMSPTAPIRCTAIGPPPAMSIASSRARSPPTCQCRRRQNTSWSSI